MTPDKFFTTIIDPTLQLLATTIALPASAEARVLLLTIAGQESEWRWRRQNGGPARGFWQFEKYGGAAEVLEKTPSSLRTICDALDIPCEISTLFEAIAWNDVLACTMARLLLWQDASPLPALGDKRATWNYYLRNWRPGAPRPKTWDGYYDRALAAVGADANQLKLV